MKFMSSPAKSSLSLATGDLSNQGDVKSCVPSPMKGRMDASADGSGVFLRSRSSFLRVADLSMEEQTAVSTNSSESIANFHRHAMDPPPGIAEDPLERWVALDDGEGNHAPVAPLAIQALVKTGFLHAVDESMWSPDAKTQKLVKKASGLVWDERLGDEVLVWSGRFNHGLYGSELPAVRAAGRIGIAARDLLDLLMDSNRVKEYNALSLGRQDLLVLQDTMDPEGPFGGLTKITMSETKPPMVRKTLEFCSILHARALADGGYQIVTRAVTHAASPILPSEILMGVNVIRPIDEHSCYMICVNHIRSPMVPLMIAKRIGLAAASNFIRDLRKL